jgi:hypothetical protein
MYKVQSLYYSNTMLQVDPFYPFITGIVEHVINMIYDIIRERNFIQK